MSYLKPWENEGPWKMLMLLQVLLSASFGLAVAATANGDWISYDVGHEGLLWGSHVLDDVYAVEKTASITWTLVLMIIGCVVTFISFFWTYRIGAAWAKSSKKSLVIDSILSSVGAWSLIVACIIYTKALAGGYAGSGQTAGSSTITHDIGFVLAWLAAVLGFVGSCVFGVFAHKTKESDFGGI